MCFDDLSLYYCSAFLCCCAFQCITLHSSALLITDVLFLCSATNDRVLIITGAPDKVKRAHELVWDEIYQRIDSSVEDAKVPYITCTAISLRKAQCFKKVTLFIYATLDYFLLKPSHLMYATLNCLYPGCHILSRCNNLGINCLFF